MLSAGLLSAQVDVPTFVQGAHQGTPSEQGSKCPECTGGFIEVNMFDPRIEGSDFKWDVHIRFHPDTPIPAAPVNRLGGVAVYFQYNTEAFTNPKDNCSYENDALPKSRNPSFGIKYNNVLNDTTPEIWARLNQSNSLWLLQEAFLMGQSENFFIVLTHEYQRLYTVSCPIADTTQLAGIEINYRGWNRIFTPTGNGAADAANQQGFVRLVSTSFARFPLNGAPAVVSQRLYGGNDGVELILSNQPIGSPNLQFVGSTTGIVYEVSNRVSGSTLFIDRTDTSSPILEDVEVQVLPDGLGNANGNYASTTTIATLPAASAYDPIVTNAYFEKAAPKNNLNIVIDSQTVLTDLYTLTSASTEDIIVDIIFRDRDGATSTHVESIVSIDESGLGIPVAGAITLVYAVELPDVVADGDLTAEIIFGANSITLTEGDNTGSLRPRHLSGFNIEVPDNVEPIITYGAITLTKLDDQSGLSSGQINNNIAMVISFSETVGARRADDAIEIVAFDIDGNEVGTIDIEGSDLTNTAMSFTLNKDILSLADHAFYGIRVINARLLQDGSGNPVSANLELVESERVRVPRLQIVEIGDPNDNTIKETTPASITQSVNNFSLQAQDGDGVLISGTGTIVWSLTGTNADLFVINETAGTAGITVTTSLDFEGSSAKSYELTVGATHASEGEAELVVRFALADVLESVEFALVGSAEIFAENTTTNTATNRMVEGVILQSSVDDTTRASADTTYRIVNTVPFEIVASGTDGEGTVRQTQAIDYETNPSYTLTLEAIVTENGVTVTSERRELDINIENLLEDITLASGSDTEGTVAEGTTDIVAGLNLVIEDEAGLSLNNEVVWTLSNSASGLFTIDASSGEISGTAGTNYEPDTIPNGYNPETPREYTLGVAVETQRGAIPELRTNIAVTVVMENVLETLVRGDGFDVDGTAYELFDNVVAGLDLVIIDERGASVDDLVWALTHDVGGSFTIDPATGVITAVGSVTDLIAGDDTHLTPIIRVSKGAIQTDAITLAIDIDNVLASLTLSDTDNDLSALAENLTEVVDDITFAVVDERNEAVTGLTWTIVTNSDNHFGIDANTGVLSVVNAFDFETGESHNVVVRVSKAQEGSGTIINSNDLTIQ